MVIVLKEGSIILAENQGLFGDDALEAVLVSQDLIVDAELGELTAFQVKIALEFNQESWVNEGHFRNLKVFSPCCGGGIMKPETSPDVTGAQGALFFSGVADYESTPVVTTDAWQEKPIAFEPLDGDSILFERRQDVTKGLLNDIPDLSDRWRSMGVTRNENHSV
jgi:hypothetical protein